MLNRVIYDADYIEFNVFRKGFDEIPEIKGISKYLVDKVGPSQKIYPGKVLIRYLLHEDVIKFIFTKKYKDWKNFYLEDISIFKNGIEIFATITHENYVIMLLDEAQYNDLNSKGFNFNFFLPFNY